MIPRKSDWPIADFPTLLGFNAFKEILSDVYQDLIGPSRLKTTIQKTNQINLASKKNSSLKVIPPIPPIESRELTDLTNLNPTIDSLHKLRFAARLKSTTQPNIQVEKELTSLKKKPSDKMISPISISEKTSPNKPSFPASLPSSNEIFIELQTDTIERKTYNTSANFETTGISTSKTIDILTQNTHYIFANGRDTSKAVQLLSSKTNSIIQLHIIYYWKDCAPHEQPEKIIYAYSNPKHPISTNRAISVLKESQHGSVETIKNRAQKKFRKQRVGLTSATQASSKATSSTKKTL